MGNELALVMDQAGKVASMPFCPFCGHRGVVASKVVTGERDIASCDECHQTWFIASDEVNGVRRWAINPQDAMLGQIVVGADASAMTLPVKIAEKAKESMEAIVSSAPEWLQERARAIIEDRRFLSSLPEVVMVQSIFEEAVQKTGSAPHILERVLKAIANLRGNTVVEDGVAMVPQKFIEDVYAAAEEGPDTLKWAKQVESYAKLSVHLKTMEVRMRKEMHGLVDINELLPWIHSVRSTIERCVEDPETKQRILRALGGNDE